MYKGPETHSIPSDILDDLSSRFIVNIPEEEKREPTRLCFQIELAYWFYLDFFCAEDPSLKICGMKEFTANIFEHVPFLTPLLKNLDKIIEDWRNYKSSVPTYGAVILNEDLTKVLLVQSFFTRASWGFPKGKVNELESPSNCAVREVMEETGLDISKIIDENDYIEAILNEHTVRLYVVSGVSENVKLRPRTRNEIKKIEWFVVNDLPTNKKDMITRIKFGVGPNTFFLVLPFIKKVRHWIHEKRQEGRAVNKSGHSRRHRHKSVGEIPANFAPLQPMQNVQKNKKQFQFNHHAQSEFVQNNSNAKNPSVPRNKPFKQEKKSNFKRQLFNDDEKSQESLYKQNISEQSEGAKNEGAMFGGAKFGGAMFEGAKNERAMFGGAKNEGAMFERAMFGGAKNEGAMFGRAKNEGAMFEGAMFGRAKNEGAMFERAKNEGAMFERAMFGGAKNEGAMFERAMFGGAKNEGAMFGRAKNEGAMFGGAKNEGAMFERAMFGGAKNEGAMFERAMFGGAKNERAMFGGAKNEGAMFGRAKNEGAMFERAKNEGAMFGRAKNEGAMFERAMFGGAKNEGAMFERAMFGGAKNDEANNEGAKNEEANNEEANNEEANNEEANNEEANNEEANNEEANNEGAKNEEAKNEEAKSEEAKNEGVEDLNADENREREKRLFYIPMWLNFKLDPAPILECFDD